MRMLAAAADDDDDAAAAAADAAACLLLLFNVQLGCLPINSTHPHPTQPHPAPTQRRTFLTIFCSSIRNARTMRSLTTAWLSAPP